MTEQDFDLQKMAGSNLASGSELVGSLFEQRYAVERLLGSGGSGRVYKCSDSITGRSVALKILAGVIDAKILRRFQIEATAISLLDHHNLVRIYECGVTDNGYPYIVMEYIDGVSLADFLAENGRMEATECVYLLLPILDALQLMHDKGVIHRDLKPSNVILFKSNGLLTAKIVDFGIAKLNTPDGPSSLNVTQTGEIFGSPLYMSPEQASGLKVDARTDQYSLGCLIFECLTGTVPHIGTSSFETLVKHKNEEAPSLKEASLGIEFAPPLEAVISKLLSKDPSKRFDSMAMARKALEDTLQNQGLNSSSQVESQKVWFSKSRLAVTAAALTAIIVTAAFVYSNLHAPEEVRVEKPSAKPQPSVDSFGAEELAVNNSQFLRFLTVNANTPELRVNPNAKKNSSGASYAVFSNEISDPAMVGFDERMAVRKLSLIDCSGLTDKGLAHVMHQRLTQVNLTNSSVGNETFKSLLQLPAMEYIGVAGTKITDEALNRGSNTIIGLDLSRTALTNKAAVSLKNYPKLRSVELSGTGIGDIKALAGLNLNGLWLSGTPITDKAASTIATFSKLSFLAVSRTQITSEFLEQISKLKELRSFELVDCPRVKLAAIEQFKKMHPKCQVKIVDKNADRLLNLK